MNGLRAPNSNVSAETPTISWPRSRSSPSSSRRASCRRRWAADRAGRTSAWRCPARLRRRRCTSGARRRRGGGRRRRRRALDRRRAATSSPEHAGRRPPARRRRASIRRPRIIGTPAAAGRSRRRRARRRPARRGTRAMRSDVERRPGVVEAPIGAGRVASTIIVADARWRSRRTWVDVGVGVASLAEADGHGRVPVAGVVERRGCSMCDVAGTAVDSRQASDRAVVARRVEDRLDDVATARCHCASLACPLPRLISVSASCERASKPAARACASTVGGGQRRRSPHRRRR